MLLAGHSLGRTFSKLLHKPDNGFLKTLLEGNILLCFSFISLFLAFGVFSNNAGAFFIIFLIVLLLLTTLEFFFIAPYLRLFVHRIRAVGFKSVWINKFQIKHSSVPVICIFLLVIILLSFHAIVIYYHPILNEYDSIYIFLPISNSILLGNGLNHDFYGGSDLSIRYPPFVQALNAWIIDLFDNSTLRSFPVYFVILTSLSVYQITRIMGRDKFFSMISVCITLVTPALLVISSRFSLQQDLPFIAFISFSMYAFLRVLRSNDIGRFDFALFIISLAILPLVREIGLLMSWFLFFSFLTLKYSRNHTYLRISFSILALIPLYALTLNDIRNVGFTSILLIRLSTLIVGNIILCFLKLSSVQNKRIHHLSRYLPLIVLFGVPASFIISNIILMKGPYPTIMFSSEFSTSLNEYRYIFDIQNKLYQNVLESLLQIPRIDLLFFSLALGSIFFLFKFKGILNLINDIRLDKVFPNVIFVYLLITVIIWSYLLNSGFTEAGIRHISYFIPILSIVIIAALNKNSISHRIYIFSMIVFALYYYLQNDIAITNQNGHFYAIWIDPIITPYISYFGLIIGVILFCGYFSIDLIQSKILKTRFNPNLKYLVPVFPIILAFGCYFIVSTNIQISSISASDLSLDRAWENNVFEVIYYLNYADEGNVLSVRAPAISYFTNRTNFDAFNPHIFGRIILPILNSTDSSILESKLINQNIKYVVLPNNNNPSHSIVNKIDNRYKFQEKLQSSHNFSSIPLDHFTIYKYIEPDSFTYDLLASNHQWQESGVNLLERDPSLLFLSNTNSSSTEFNRLYLKANIPQSSKPLLMALNYSSAVQNENTSFLFEIRNSFSENILYSRNLQDTNQENYMMYLLVPPKTTGKDIEIRFYIITNEPGKSYLHLNEVKLSSL